MIRQELIPGWYRVTVKEGGGMFATGRYWDGTEWILMNGESISHAETEPLTGPQVKSLRRIEPEYYRHVAAAILAPA